MKQYFFCVFMILFGFSCGVKAPPLPPDPTLAEEVSAIKGPAQKPSPSPQSRQSFQ